jgi:hypothetical protein
MYFDERREIVCPIMHLPTRKERAAQKNLLVNLLVG